MLCVSVMTIVARRVTQRWYGTSSHQRGTSVSRMRPKITPPYMFLLPGNGPRSTSRVRRPARAATIAAQEPAGPPPATITSKSTSAMPALPEQGEQGVQRRVGIGGHGEVGELHHR